MHISDAVRALDRDLHDVFGARLRSVVVYSAAHDAGRPLTPTLVVVDRPTADDLRALAARVAGWHDAGLGNAAPPRVARVRAIARRVSARIRRHPRGSRDRVWREPFDGLRVDPSDLRHAAEVQARSHLIHLREGYIETAGRGDALADLITRSASALAPLVASVARLLGETAPDSTDSATDSAAAAQHVERRSARQPGAWPTSCAARPTIRCPPTKARRLFPAYLNAIERLTVFVDQWHA